MKERTKSVRIIVRKSVIDGCPERRVFAVVSNDVAGELTTQMWDGERYANIGELEVYPEYRRQGIGRRLLGGIIGEAVKDRGLHELNVTVRWDNIAARRAYESVGFVLDDQIKRTGPDAENFVDMVLDVRPLRNKKRAAKSRRAVAKGGAA